MDNTTTNKNRSGLRRALCLIIIIELACMVYMSREVYSLSAERVLSGKERAAAVHILSTVPVLSINAKAAAAPLIFEEEHRWKGPVLTKRKGTITGPSGKETYYNLNMSIVVRNMHRMGFEGDYWVRDDGVKMFGDYVMVAANLKKHPRGSLVETSLGTGIVCDTGGFAARNPSQLDIAVAW